jgi:hypothetical protein
MTDKANTANPNETAEPTELTPEELAANAAKVGLKPSYLDQLTPGEYQQWGPHPLVQFGEPPEEDSTRQMG